MKVLAINSSARKDGNTANLLVTAARRGGALNTLDALNHFFMLQNMFIAGSSYWPMAYGQIGKRVEAGTSRQTAEVPAWRYDC